MKTLRKVMFNLVCIFLAILVAGYGIKTINTATSQIVMILGIIPFALGVLFIWCSLVDGFLDSVQSKILASCKMLYSNTKTILLVNLYRTPISNVSGVENAKIPEPFVLYKTSYFQF